ncbi:transporter [Sphingomonas montanisoli]|uniref:Transporter n=1 Tax=Sphingomonas montanisoli TaxID=2606412 RepID=A0A5D9CBS2_9SPHN|nr:transporter [Sphingomonas montanisoli]TZG28612.1 transporter [Sphingomonas montanisoli]
MRYWMIAALVLAMPASAQAADLRDYCSDRPGIGTPPCIIDKGHVSLEIGLADWTLDRTADERDSQYLLGAALIRFGLTDITEVQLGWDGFGIDDDRDRISGTRRDAHRAGDMTVALRQSLANPDGSGLSIALQPYATLPVGREPIGAGDWGTGLLVPVNYALNDRLKLEMMPEVDAAVDDDGHGRHLAFGSVIGLTDKLSEKVTASVEMQALRDRDPTGHATMMLAGLSLGWQPSDNWQLDVGSNAGLNHNSPDVELYLGVSRRF